MIRRPARRDATRRSRAGQAMAELALALPILLLVIFGLFEAGAFAFTLMTVEHAAQDGGRLAALPPNLDNASEAAVKDYVVDRAALAPVTLAATDITITVSGCSVSPCTYTTRDSGARVRLVVNYTYNPMIAMVFGNGTTFPLTAQTEYYVE